MLHKAVSAGLEISPFRSAETRVHTYYAIPDNNLCTIHSDEIWHVYILNLLTDPACTLYLGGWVLEMPK